MVGIRPDSLKISIISGVSGGPGAIRTPDPQIRSLMLYPAELRVHRGAAFSPGHSGVQGKKRKATASFRIAGR